MILKIVIIALVILGSFSVINYFQDFKEDLEEGKYAVVDPAIGEKWNSIKEYRFRNDEVKEDG